jgi:Tol biopolymer transport system component/protocatechuate 3,4-dioxygenase beta subunit
MEALGDDAASRSAVNGTATQLVSVSSQGVPANSSCKNPDISYDGRFVAFECRASNLVPNDTNKVSDVFVHDRLTGATERVSIGPNGIQANGASDEPAISDDGRFVVFTSKAKNLIPPPAQAVGFASYRGPGINVYVHDRQTGTTSLVSMDANGQPADRRAWLPDISPDGRYIVYSSHSEHIVVPDMNGIKRDAFIYDRVTGTTEYADVMSNGLNPWSGGSIAAISAGGRVVTYRSKAGDLVRDDTNRKFDIFAYERSTLDIKRVSVSTGGQQANGDAHNPQVSADGRFIVYESPAQLDSRDQNSSIDVYVHYLPAAATSLASLTANGHAGNNPSVTPILSGDGRYIAYSSKSSDLVPGDTNGLSDVFIYDQATGETIRVSLGDNDQQATGGASVTPAISGDGRFVAFVSAARNLIDGITSRPGGIYVRALDTDAPFYHITGVVRDGNGQPLAGVAIATGDGRMTQTGDDGRYTLEALPAGTYTVSAEKLGYTFAPESRTITVWPDATGQDFTATALTYLVSGTVLDDTGSPLVGVTISGGDVSTQTDAEGRYALELPTGVYTLTAEKGGYWFDPATREVTVPPDAADVDFTGTLLVYSVSGTVLDGTGSPLVGVTISSGDGTTQTDAEGRYGLELPTGVHMLTAEKEGYSFDPATREVAVPPDAADVDFTGTLLVYAVSGTVRDDTGSPLAAATVSAGNGYETQTDSDGRYALSLPAGSYELSAELAGYDFGQTPQLISVPPNATGVDFTGVLLTYAISGMVTDSNGQPLAGVTISDVNGHSTMTEIDGTYNLAGLPAGDYMLQASLDGYTFNSLPEPGISVPPAATDVNFVGTAVIPE